jgi:hypothetical protein
MPILVIKEPGPGGDQIILLTTDRAAIAAAMLALVERASPPLADEATKRRSRSNTGRDHRARADEAEGSDNG